MSRLNGIKHSGAPLFTDVSMKQKVDFLREIDQLKTIFRRTILLDRSRQENDAEHSWELATMAVILHDYASPGTNLLTCIKMLLIHDLVEIYAGDTYAYHWQSTANQHELESRAAEKIFGLLPDPLCTDMILLWEEFEARQSREAKFSRALDRLQPLFHNYYTEGLSWQKHGVTASQVRKTMSIIREASEQLGNLVDEIIDDSVNRGFLPENAPD